jgi:hypothetical protein
LSGKRKIRACEPVSRFSLKPAESQLREHALLQGTLETGARACALTRAQSARYRGKGSSSPFFRRKLLRVFHENWATRPAFALIVCTTACLQSRSAPSKAPQVLRTSSVAGQPAAASGAPTTDLRQLWRAAATQTNLARSHFQAALTDSSATTQRSRIEQCIDAYGQARPHWEAFLVQNADPVRAEDGAFWLADASYWIVVLNVTISRSPPTAEVERARRDARTVLYNERWLGRYRQALAYYLVSIADKLLDDAVRLRARPTSGAADRAPNKKGPTPEAPPSLVSNEVIDAIKARDEYLAAHVTASTDPRVRRVGPDDDPNIVYAFEAAALLSFLGRGEDARTRLDTLLQYHCGRDKWGLVAQRELLKLAEEAKNISEIRRLSAIKCSPAE